MAELAAVAPAQERRSFEVRPGSSGAPRGRVWTPRTHPVSKLLPAQAAGKGELSAPSRGGRALHALIAAENKNATLCLAANANMSRVPSASCQALNRPPASPSPSSSSFISSRIKVTFWSRHPSARAAAH